MDVSAMNLSGFSPEVLADSKLDLPYYLAHFHQIANSVVMASEPIGIYRDFIGIPRLKLVTPYRLALTSTNC